MNDTRFILAITVLIVIIVIAVAVYIDWNAVRNRFSKNISIPNELTFWRQYLHSGDYHPDDRLRKESIEKILDKYRNYIIQVESKFNDIYYAVFDLDTQEHRILFEKLYSANSYVLFMSSEEHFWGIVDMPYTKKYDIFMECNWKICNDSKYVNFAVDKKLLLMRGLYENKERKPHLVKINGNLSENFQLFIDKLSTYYDKEGFEMSVLRYKDPEMLIKYNRKRKLQKINDCQI